MPATPATPNSPALPPIQSAKLPELRYVIRLENPGEEAGEATAGMLAWSAMLAGAAAISQEELAARQAGVQFDDAANIQYTSGTTGSPKGATLSHHNILNNGYFVARLQGFTEQDRLCAPVPLTTASAVSWRRWAA